jgi:hypothetical protein
MGKVSKRRNRSGKKKHRFLMKGGAMFFADGDNRALSQQGEEMQRRLMITLLLSGLTAYDRGVGGLNQLLGIGVLPTTLDALQAMATGGYETITALAGGSDLLVRIVARAAYYMILSPGGQVTDAAAWILGHCGSFGLQGASMLVGHGPQIMQSLGVLIGGLALMGIDIERVIAVFESVRTDIVESMPAVVAPAVAPALTMLGNLQAAYAQARIVATGEARALAEPAVGAAAVMGVGALNTGAAVYVQFDAAVMLILRQGERVHERLPVVTTVLLTVFEGAMQTMRTGNPAAIINVATNITTMAGRWVARNAQAVCVMGRDGAAAAQVSAVQMVRATATLFANWTIDQLGFAAEAARSAQHRREILGAMGVSGDGSHMGLQQAHDAAHAHAAQLEVLWAAQYAEMVAVQHLNTPGSPQAGFLRWSPAREQVLVAAAQQPGAMDPAHGFLALDEAAAVLALASVEYGERGMVSPSRIADDEADAAAAAEEHRPGYGIAGVPDSLDVMGSMGKKGGRGGNGKKRGREEEPSSQGSNKVFKPTACASVDECAVVAADSERQAAEKYVRMACGGRGGGGGGGRKTKRTKRHRKRATKKHRRKSYKRKSRRMRR